MLPPASIGELRRAIHGRVISPRDAEFDATRATFNGMIERHPAVIVRPIDAVDVATAVQFADAEGIPISIRGGGHAVAGHSMGDHALAIDLAYVKRVSVDPGRRRATVGGGATWEDFDPDCVRFGLATTGGTVSDTGIGGLTLGGGIGFLQSSCGLAIDNLLSAEVVVADGRILISNEEENADLFWAIRGGGGNFGVVTSFEFRLHPIDTFLGGMIVYPIAEAPRVLRLWRDLAGNASDSLMSICGMWVHPDPQATRAVAVAVCFRGSIEAGEEEIRPLREGATVLADGVRPMGYLDVQAMYGKDPFGLRHYWKGFFLGDLPDEVIDRCVEAAERYPSLGGGFFLEEIHGAPAEVPNDAMAFNQRSARFNVSAIAQWESEALDAEGTAWVREFMGSVEPYSDIGAGYVNYLTDIESAGRIQAIYGPAKFERLRRIKRAHDPKNHFHFNQNIPPADSAPSPL